MGLLSGTASFTRFTVEGEVPEHFWDFVAQRVAEHSFQDIDDTIDEYSIGWVSVADMFDSEFAFSSYAAGDYVVLSLRIDERKVVPAVLKKFIAKEESRVRQEKGVRRLPRSVRLEIKERIQAELVRKSPPIPAVYELCWNLSSNTLLFFSNSRKAIALLEDLFKETFDLSLLMQIPWTTALRQVNQETADKLANLQPALLI